MKIRTGRFGAWAPWLVTLALLSACDAQSRAGSDEVAVDVPEADEPIAPSDEDDPAQPMAPEEPASSANGQDDVSKPGSPADPGDSTPDDEPLAPPAPVNLTPSTSHEVERAPTLTADAVLPEGLPAYRSVQVDEASLTFVFAGDVGDAIGVGSVLAGHAGGGYLRRVLEVEALGDGHMRYHTEDASITDLIADGHFRLRAAALDAAQVQKAQIALPAALPCTLEATGEVVEITPSYTFDPTLELEVDIGYDDGLHRPVLRYARAVVRGDLTMSVKLASHGKLHGKCSADLLAALTPVQWTTNFALGLLPITVRHHIGPSLVVALDLLLEGGLSTTASVSVSLEAGLEYKCGQFRPIEWQSEVSGGLEVEPTAKGTLTGTLTPALGYELELLGVASASAGIRADLVGRVSADAVACTWDASLDASVTAYAHAHLTLPIVGSELLSIDEERTLWSQNLASDMGMLPWCD